MLNSKLKTHNSQLTAQSTLEYALIIAVVVAALSAMSVYVQRSIQANLKTVEDQINANP